MAKYKLAMACWNKEDIDFTEQLDSLADLDIEYEGFLLNHSQDPEVVINALKDFDYVIAGSELYSKETMPYLPKLKLIMRFGIGYDNIDMQCASEEGIAAANLPGCIAGSVAEHSLSLMLALARDLEGLTQTVKNGGYGRTGMLDSLEGSTVGLLGFGAIAKKLAKLLSGFDVELLAYDPYVSEEDMAKLGAKKCTLEEVRAKADFLSLHLPDLPETRHMIDEEFIAQMKDGAYLINTARGRIVDEYALAAALESGKLKGAGLDVFEFEPPAADNPLRKQKRVLFTPHCAAANPNCFKYVMDLALEDIRSFHTGGKIRSLLNPDYIENVSKRENPLE